MKKILLLLSLFHFSPFTFHLVAQSWQPYPVQGGGLINEVTFDPVDSNVIYAASGESGLFKSSDGGNNWQNLFSPDHFISTYSYYCRDVEVSAQNHNELFAVCGVAPWGDTAHGFLFHSMDAGNSFTALNCPVSVTGTSAFSNAGHIMLINPGNGAQIFLAGQPEFNFNSGNAYYSTSGLYVSGDHGSSWVSVADSLKTFWITQMSFNPANPNELFFAVRNLNINGINSGGGGLYKYNVSNGSVTKLFSQDVLEFAFDAGNSQIIIANCTGHINISTDGGTTWSVNISPLYDWTDYFVTAHPTEGGHWFVGGHSGNAFEILETIDYGALWRSAEFKHNPNKQLLQFNDASCDYKPEFGYYMGGINFSPLNPKLVFLNDDHALWKSYDGDTLLCKNAIAGSSSNWEWKYSMHGIQNIQGKCLTRNPQNGKIFFGGTDPALFVSDDNGQSCSQLILPDAYCTQVSAIAFSKTNPFTGYIGGSYYYDSDGKFFKTIDGGNTWTQLAYNYFDRDSNNIQNVTQIAISDFSPDTIVVGCDVRNGQSPIHISTDGGSTWANWSQGIAATNPFPIWNWKKKIFTDGSGYFFIVNGNHLYRRKANENSWTEITNPGGTNWWFTEAKAAQGKIYVSYYNNQIFYSSDHGDTWSNISVQTLCVSYMEISPAGIIALVQCDDAANNIPAQISVSFDQGASFVSVPLNGLHGRISAIGFAGSYTLVCLSENTGAFFFDLNQVGVDQLTIDNGQLTVFPNPASEELFINSYSLLVNAISIEDVLGRTVLRITDNTDQISNLDVSNLSNGIYTLRVVTDKTILSKQFVIQR